MSNDANTVDLNNKPVTPAPVKPVVPEPVKDMNPESLKRILGILLKFLGGAGSLVPGELGATWRKLVDFLNKFATESWFLDLVVFVVDLLDGDGNPVLAQGKPVDVFAEIEKFVAKKKASAMVVKS